jgi:hypothetical protein
MIDKNLIKKVLRESINAKELLDIGSTITSMYNDLGKVTASRKTGKTSADDLFWYVIDLLDYKKDNDYKRVNRYLTDLNRLAGVPTKTIKLIKSILDLKINTLDLASDGGKGINVSDDSWSDLRYDVVSRGKEFFHEVVDDPSIMEKMAKEYDYTESFAYGFPFEDELI